jgi:beta-lactamase class C
MKKVLFSLIILITFLLISSKYAQAKQPIDPKTTVDKTINTLMQKYHVPGMAIALYVNGKPYHYYYGYEQNTRATPINNNSIFEVGSLTKLFTTLLLAIEVNAGKMQLNQPLVHYWDIPHCSTATQKITLENLATHTTGLPLRLPNTIRVAPSLTKFLADWNPAAPLGTQWQYSNIGTNLIGTAIENVTDKNYDQLLEEHILKPLGMQLIGVHVPNSYQIYYVQGYNEKGRAVPKTDSRNLPAAGALKASLYNMQLFLKAAIGLNDVPANLRQAMQMTQTPFVRLANFMQGLAWEIHPINSQTKKSLLNQQAKKDLGPLPAEVLPKNQQIFNGDALIDKTGATDGFRSYIAVIPNQKTGIVILMNRYVPNEVIVAAGREILFTLDNLSKN